MLLHLPDFATSFLNSPVGIHNFVDVRLSAISSIEVADLSDARMALVRFKCCCAPRSLCVMGKAERHQNPAPRKPDMKGYDSPRVESLTWKCEVCSMHYAFGRAVTMPAKCERCGGKVFKAYWSII